MFKNKFTFIAFVAVRPEWANVKNKIPVLLHYTGLAAHLHKLQTFGPLVVKPAYWEKN